MGGGVCFVDPVVREQRTVPGIEGEGEVHVWIRRCVWFEERCTINRGTDVNMIVCTRRGRGKAKFSNYDVTWSGSHVEIYGGFESACASDEVETTKIECGGARESG